MLLKQSENTTHADVTTGESVAALIERRKEVERQIQSFALAGAPIEFKYRFSPSRLAATRKRLDISSVQCGSLLGVSFQAVLNWESGKYKPYPRNLRALAELESMPKRDVAWRLQAAAVQRKSRSAEIDPFESASFAANRRRLNLSASQCGRLLSVSYQTVIGWESAGIRPHANKRANIAALMSMTVEDARERLLYLKLRRT